MNSHTVTNTFALFLNLLRWNHRTQQCAKKPRTHLHTFGGAHTLLHTQLHALTHTYTQYHTTTHIDAHTRTDQLTYLTRTRHDGRPSPPPFHFPLSSGHVLPPSFVSRLNRVPYRVHCVVSCKASCSRSQTMGRSSLLASDVTGLTLVAPSWRINVISAFGAMKRTIAVSSSWRPAVKAHLRVSSQRFVGPPSALEDWRCRYKRTRTATSLLIHSSRIPFPSSFKSCASLTCTASCGLLVSGVVHVASWSTRSLCSPVWISLSRESSQTDTSM